MLKGIDENGNLQNVFVSEDGALKVKVDGEENVKKETTILSGVITQGTTTASLALNMEVTSIMVANYSETATITINEEYKVGPNIAVELPINKVLPYISFSSTEDNTNAQVVVKGVM